ncbi:MAG: GntR family transcriptional regulator [Anaerolineales bacterium]
MAQDNVIQPIKKQSLADSIFLRLRANILNGLMKPGERLVEMNIAKQFGTSQAPVREAFRRLDQVGLVETLPYHGTFIKDIPIEEYLEINSIRMVLERMAAQRFLKRAKSEHIQLLQEYIDEMWEAVNSGDFDTLVERDIDFHELICRESGSTTLFEVWSLIHGKARLSISAADRHHQHNLDEIVQMHQSIVDALWKDDEKSLINAVETHSRIALERLKAINRMEEDETNNDYQG